VGTPNTSSGGHSYGGSASVFQGSASSRSMAKARAETKLPAGLAKNARAKHEAKRQRLADEGFKAISAIKALRTKIADDYLEMGRALRVLKQEGVAEAVGCASFEALCREKLDLSVTRAEQLIALFETLDADTVRALGADRASALMNLAGRHPLGRQRA
jgi:hypothetical protein